MDSEQVVVVGKLRYEAVVEADGIEICRLDENVRWQVAGAIQAGQRRPFVPLHVDCDQIRAFAIEERVDDPGTGLHQKRGSGYRRRM